MLSEQQVFLLGLLRPRAERAPRRRSVLPLPWDGAREDDGWERDKERRENHQIWGYRGLQLQNAERAAAVAGAATVCARCSFCRCSTLCTHCWR
jgi:hypothetical protein